MQNQINNLENFKQQFLKNFQEELNNYVYPQEELNQISEDKQRYGKYKNG